MQECIFCKIAKGEIPSYKVYEDESTLAFFDINPITKGHTLVIPKEHVQSFSESTPATAAKLAEGAAKVTKALKKVLKPEGFNYFINEGRIAGQEVMHLHLHIVPRYSESEVKFELEKAELSSEEMKTLAEKIFKET